MASLKRLIASSLVVQQVLAHILYAEVPQCPEKGTISYAHSVPNRTAFPETQVDLCYDETSIFITFTAYNETSFYFNSSYESNDPIWQYEVMEAFVARGISDPRTYLEVEIAPNNVTFSASIHNPSKLRLPDARFDTAYWNASIFPAQTTLDKEGQTWISTMQIPFSLFNVDDGDARGTDWRMNFFRTQTSSKMFPNQLLGAWSVPDEANFHVTPVFGHIRFV